MSDIKTAQKANTYYNTKFLRNISVFKKFFCFFHYSRLLSILYGYGKIVPNSKSYKRKSPVNLNF